ncbi:hypothetical protein L2E82_39481 [Cichorium intybus]|uniref:Uncharacterized protein n=1 Tax=Cichorium intybus TaxID=13427 RepID=A0ACB9AID4_CICIN|nr:hypothetical protein L2E82_39481 [Cichorium intybus]
MASVLWLCVLAAVLHPSSSSKQTYIVQMKHYQKPTSYLTHSDWYSHHLQALTSATADALLYSYSTAYHGFAASLDPQQAQALRESDSVLGVYEDTVYQLHTTRTPEFLGIENELGFLSGQTPQQFSVASNDVIIGVLDTGVWPESKSFDDSGMPAVPTRWRGECEEDEYFKATLCNKKLVGARKFYNGFRMAAGEMMNEKLSPRDFDGHGTHTSSTAAGVQVGNASLFGGLNPRAEKGAVVKEAGGIGMILANTAASGEELVADSHLLPAMAVGRKVGDEIREYLTTEAKPTVVLTFGGTVLGVKPSPVVAAFSSRGPNKVEVEAPEGVEVIVKPERLVFEKVGERVRYTVTFVSEKKGGDGGDFGRITWKNGENEVRSPVAFSWV